MSALAAVAVIGLMLVIFAAQVFALVRIARGFFGFSRELTEPGAIARLLSADTVASLRARGVDPETLRFQDLAEAPDLGEQVKREVREALVAQIRAQGRLGVFGPILRGRASATRPARGQAAPEPARAPRAAIPTVDVGSRPPPIDAPASGSGRIALIALLAGLAAAAAAHFLGWG